MPLIPQRDARWVFIGDSITDCARGADPEEIGNGYVRMVRDYLLAKDPAIAPTIINRGISGHKVTDLRDRWQRDVIDLSPNVLSIMIGVNDVWHSLMPGGAGVPVEEYRRVYRENIKKVREKLPKCEIVLCEPSVIWPPQDARAQEMLEPYVNAVRELAQSFGIHYLVKLQDAFARAREARADVEWCPDGVHPSSAGHALIARTWLSATGLL